MIRLFMLHAELVLLLLIPLPSRAAVSFTNPLSSQLAPGSSNPPFISSAYPLSDTVGVRVPLKWSFSIGFLSDTCGGGSDIVYSSTGLPQWMTFSSDDITFYGQTPDSPEDVHVILLCDQMGDKTSETFLVRAKGQLQLDVTLPPLSVSPRNPVSYRLEDILDHVSVDGRALTASQQVELLVETPGSYNWLGWNSTSQELQGVPPDGYINVTSPQSATIPITFALPSILSNTTSLNITIEPYILTSFDYPPVYVVNHLRIPLEHLLNDPSASLSVSFDPTNASQWISFDPSSLLLVGTVPPGSSSQTLTVSLSATSHQSPFDADASFEIITTSQVPQLLPFLARSTIILISIISVTGVLLLFALGYFFAFRWCRPDVVSRGRGRCRAPRENIQSKPLRERRPAGSTSTTEKDVVIDSADVRAVPKARLKWWTRRGRDHVTLDLVPARSQSRKRSPSQDAGSPNLPASDDRSEVQQVGTSSRVSHYSSSLKKHEDLDNALSPLAPSDAGPSSTDSWGLPVPKPPKGLSPQETAAWVDNYVCEWTAAYAGASGKRRKKRDSHQSKRISSGRSSRPESQEMGDGGPWIPQPESSAILHHNLTSPSSEKKPIAVSPIMQLLDTSSVYLSSIPNFMNVPKRVIQRSVSYPNTINTITTASSLRPSDASSIASWDSLDSWEVERRHHYEEPKRRGDFVPDAGERSAGRAQATGRQEDRSRSRSRGRGRSDRTSAGPPPATGQSSSSGEGVSVDGENTSSDEVPSIVVTAFGDSASGGNVSAEAHEERTQPGGASNSVDSPTQPISVKRSTTQSPSTSETRPSKASSSSEPVNKNKHTVGEHRFDDEEEDVVFFPRPIGAEVPGTGLARSPQLEGLSRFSGRGMRL